MPNSKERLVIAIDSARGISHQEDLKASYQCGSGQIIGNPVTTIKGTPVVKFNFTFPVSDDLLRAMQRAASQTIGCVRYGVRPNTKNNKQAVLLLNTQLSFQQKIEAARSFRDKVIDWCNQHPDGSDTARKRSQGRPDTRDADRRQAAPSGFTHKG